ncbi:Oligopeptidase A [Hafnia alvei]|uniref:Oligopeptidase A n=1 Tax=Hafnia alvei TaxID=569 RepID=A0A377PDQ0_HAFAL|nr:Oligopeptidase A [Hafnia alvei]
MENSLRDFELSGIGLPKEKQQRYGEIMARLSELGSAFSNNVLDATMGWSKLITDEKELSGLPESALAAAKALAESKEKEGWLLTLDIPSYLPVMTYADNRELRHGDVSGVLPRVHPIRGQTQVSGITAKSWLKLCNCVTN